MSRFYRTVRVVLRWAVGVYFFDIQSTGEDEIPNDDPVIFAANHPNSIMDTVLLGARTDRQIHYMARSGLFKNPLVRLLFNQVGVIPIYKADATDGDHSRKNVDSFERAYQTLEAGDCIGIFPEGANSPDRQVRQLKTGTARIALAAEDRNQFQLGVRILPVGLNFDDRDRFLSSVLVRFGTPIDVRDYADEYAEDQRATVRKLTDRIQKKLRRLATHIHDERNRQLVMDIHQIYGHELRRQLIGEIDTELDLRPLKHRLIDRARSADQPRQDLEDRFDIEQLIADAVDHYQRNDPGVVARLRMDIRRYRDHLEQVRLRHELLEDGIKEQGQRREAIKMTAYAILLGAPAIWGLINNFVPFVITRFVVKRQPDEAMVTFAGFATGLVAFPLFYFLQSWGWWRMTEQSIPVVVLYLTSLPITGFFFLRWWRQILTYRDRILSRTFFRTEENLLQTLERERRNLIETFTELKDRYLEARNLTLEDKYDTSQVPVLDVETEEAQQTG